MENNIFSPVVLEPAADPAVNIIGPSLLASILIPIADSDDVKGSGLNE